MKHNWLLDLPWRGIFAVLGGILLQLTLGTVYTYGNIDNYLFSYMRIYGPDPNISIDLAPYVFSFQVSAHSCSVWIGGLVESQMGPTFTSLLGGWLFSLSSLWTAYTCKNYYIVLFTYGILNGMGSGLAYGVSMAVGMRYFPKHKGLINGLILSGYGLGAFIFNPLITYIINPDNFILPDGDTYYPSDHVQNVPKCFYILGFSYAAIQLVGSLLLRNPKEKTQEEKIEEEQRSSEIEIQQSEFTREEVDHGLTLKETLKTKQFYCLWCITFCNSIAVTLTSSFWKEMGMQRVTHNDSLLAWAGSISSICNALARPFWGNVADRLGFRVVMAIIVLSMCILQFTFYYVSAIYFCIGGNYALIPTEVASGFGQKNFGLLYGLVLTSQIISSNLGSFLSSVLMKKIGLHGLVIIVSGFALLSGCIVIFLYRTYDWRKEIFGPERTESTRQSKASFAKVDDKIEFGTTIIDVNNKELLKNEM